MPQRPRLPRTVWVLGVVSLLMDLSSETVHALLPAFLTVTLGVSAAAMGALDGVAEATANIAKIVSGTLSDRQARRKPWVLLGYGMAAASKPLFPLAQAALPILGARFVDRIGKGIRGAPRDAMIADETPPELRGAAFGLRQSLDTVGGFLAPLLAVALMLWLAGDIRTILWLAVIPAALSFLVALVFLKETGSTAPIPVKSRWGGLGDLDPSVRTLLVIGFLFGLARFSEGFLILKALEVGVAVAWSPMVLALFSLAYLLLAYPAGRLSDHIDPRSILLAGIAVLIAGNLVLAASDGVWGVALGVILWGAHMALTQGILSRMLADAASADRRATSFGAFFFVSGIAALIASVTAGLLWDRVGSSATFVVSALAALTAAIVLRLVPAQRPSEAA